MQLVCLANIFTLASNVVCNKKGVNAIVCKILAKDPYGQCSSKTGSVHQRLPGRADNTGTCKTSGINNSLRKVRAHQSSEVAEVAGVYLKIVHSMRDTKSFHHSRLQNTQGVPGGLIQAFYRHASLKLCQQIPRGWADECTLLQQMLYHGLVRRDQHSLSSK